jgi:hypothetical protein
VNRRAGQPETMWLPARQHEVELPNPTDEGAEDS